MKERVYIINNMLLRRKQNTLYFEKLIENEKEEEREEAEEYYFGKQLEIPAGDKKYMPIENIDSIFTFGHINFNSRLIYFLSRNSIPMHIFSIRGNYAGSFLPGERNISGSTMLKQAEFYSNYKKRIEIGKTLLEAAAHNQLMNLKYHNRRRVRLEGYITEIEELKSEMKNCSTINELMGLEGIIKRTYYEAWRSIFAYPINFSKRLKNPPPDMINSLISYGNTIVYGTCLNEIYMTRLYPEIGFVHEPGDSKLSLSYDIADIFKPLITDRAIFKVINKNIIGEKDFFTKNGFCRIKKDARQKFAMEIENRLLTKISLAGKQQKYSLRRVIREECYNLIKHFNEEKQYEAYKSKW